MGSPVKRWRTLVRVAALLSACAVSVSAEDLQRSRSPSFMDRLRSLSLSWLRGGSSAGIFIPAPLSPKSSRHGLEHPELREPAQFNVTQPKVEQHRSMQHTQTRYFADALERQHLHEMRDRVHPLKDQVTTKRSVEESKNELSTSWESKYHQRKVRKIETISDGQFDGPEMKEFTMPAFTTKGAEILREIEDLNHADDLFEVFPTQADAFRFADCRPSLGLQVFAADKESTGAKKYVVATYKGFWRKYKLMPPSERHLAEMIRKGATCRLYFDLEFPIKKEDDREKMMEVGNARVDCMLNTLDPMLRERFKGEVEGELQVLELDSSTSVKFSRHLIVPNVVFRDNQHVGAFVRHLAEALPEDVRSCVDQGVYTKNRCFRMLHSSKLGKHATFELSHRAHPFKWSPQRHSNGLMRIMYSSRVPGHGGRQDEAELLFMHSLITFTSHHSTLLHDPDAYAKQRRRSSVGGAGGNGTRAEESGTYKASPLPELDRFVTQQARPGAQIKQWVLYRGSCTISYALLRNRYCERIRRPHKSNHVAVVVDVARGCWRQKCLDPDCASYRPIDHPLPPALFEQRLLKALEREEARETARSKIRESLEALVELKRRQIKGTLTGEDARRLLGTGVQVAFNATHVSLFHCSELWRELRALGFSYDLRGKGWVQVLPAVVLRAGLSKSHELTRERLVRLLERAFLEEEMSLRDTDSSAAPDAAHDPWDDALHFRLEQPEQGGEGRVVVAEARRGLTAEERARVWNGGFRFEAARGVWRQPLQELRASLRRARGKEAREEGEESGEGDWSSRSEGEEGEEGEGRAEEEAREAGLEAIRRAPACRVEVEGEAVTVWDAPFGARRMEEAGFREVAGGGGLQCWWRRGEEVAQMLGLVSAIDISADNLLAALELTAPARTPTPVAEGGELLDALKVQVTHGTVEGGPSGWEGRPGRVEVEAPASMRRHLQGLGFREKKGGGQGGGGERVSMLLTEAEVRHLIRVDFAGGGIEGTGAVTAEAVRGLIERSAETAGRAMRGLDKSVVKVRAGEVLVENGYELAKALREAGLTWDRQRRAWVGSVQQVWEDGAEPDGKVGRDGVKVVATEELLRGLARPRVVVEEGTVAVERSYSVREELKARGFRWDLKRRAWVHSLRRVLHALALASPDALTVDKILAQPAHDFRLAVRPAPNVVAAAPGRAGHLAAEGSDSAPSNEERGKAAASKDGGEVGDAGASEEDMSAHEISSDESQPAAKPRVISIP